MMPQTAKPHASSTSALVATLVAPEADRYLDLALVARLRAIIGAAEVAILSPGRAIDLHFTGTGDVIHTLREALTGLPIDMAVQPSSGRRKKLFLADMDSTMIVQECIDELADAAGLKAHVSAITERAMRGEIAFEPALRERVGLLKGLSATIVNEIITTRITLMPGGTELVATMRANGAYTALVSGGFTVFTGPIAAKIGFNEHRSNELVTHNGQFSGKVSEPILGREAKRATLEELRTRLGLPVEATLAVGDGANDLAMLEEAGLGVAFHAKPVVAEAAHARVDFTDLKTLLYFQGYSDAEIVARV